jgi:D-sedoheptulose 7-phosphate isomerase
LLRESIETARCVLESLERRRPQIEEAVQAILNAFRTGNKVLLCGNGGSACDASHLAAELVGHYKIERRALPAVSLSSDGPLLSCLGNDFAFEDIFARQVEALGNRGDILVAFTTSGNSRNVVRAIEAAGRLGVISIAFLGAGGGLARGLANIEILVESQETARIQEAHLFLLHVLMDGVEQGLTEVRI